MKKAVYLFRSYVFALRKFEDIFFSVKNGNGSISKEFDLNFKKEKNLRNPHFKANLLDQRPLWSSLRPYNIL